MLHSFTFCGKFVVSGLIQHADLAVFLEGSFAFCTNRFEGFLFLYKKGKRK